MVCGFKLHHWPILTVAWYVATFVISYLVAVFGSENVYWLFPFISDTGTEPPESCIFGQMLNLGAVFMLITMYVRYRHVEFFVDSGEIDLKRSWNTASKWCGVIACLGVSFVANFQETAVAVMHFLGALGAFGVGSVYFLIQTRIAYAFRKIYYKSPETGVSRSFLWWRIYLSGSLLPLFFANSICSVIAFKQFDGESITWWTEEDAAFEMHLAATTTEWILVINFLLYVLSLTKELRDIEFQGVFFKNKCQK